MIRTQPRWPRPFGRGARAGFTFVEMLIVFIVIGLMAAMASRPLARSWGASARRSAMREMTAYFFQARAMAVQQSRTVWVARSGNTLKVLRDSAGTPVSAAALLDLGAGYAVTLTSPATDTVRYDSRGFAVMGGSLPMFIVARDGQADTLCVVGLGRIGKKNQGCL